MVSPESSEGSDEPNSRGVEETADALFPDCGCSATSAIGCFSLSTFDCRRARNHIKIPMRNKPQTPPTTPPTIAPVLLFDESATEETPAPTGWVGPEVSEERIVDTAEVSVDKEAEVAIEDEVGVVAEEAVEVVVVLST